MFFTALTDFSSYPSFETHTGRHSAVGVYVSLWSCCLCMSPEVWFSPQSLCNHFVFREESEYKLLLFWLYTYFSAGKYHGIKKVVKIQEVYSEVINGFNCVCGTPVYCVSWALISTQIHEIWRILLQWLKILLPPFFSSLPRKCTLIEEASRSCKTGISQLLLLSASLLKPIFISSWWWKAGICDKV